MVKKQLKRDYLTITEIAKLYGVSRLSVYQRLFGRIRKKGSKRQGGMPNIPYSKVANLIVLKRKDLSKLGY